MIDAMARGWAATSPTLAQCSLGHRTLADADDGCPALAHEPIQRNYRKMRFRRGACLNPIVNNWVFIPGGYLKA